MRIRGERECQECSTRWSYFETGSINCPNCGSIKSVGVGEERRRHTDSPAELNLTSVRERVDHDPLHRVTDEAKALCREYVRRRGFIHGGDLLDLDDRYLAATELLHAADVVGRRFDPDETEELYVLELLRGADAGERPGVEDVPESMREARGLAYADAVDDYLGELREWLDDRTPDAREDPDVREMLDTLSQHVRRIRALDGDVEPRTAETLVAATRDVAAAIRDGSESDMATARDRVDRL